MSTGAGDEAVLDLCGAASPGDSSESCKEDTLRVGVDSDARDDMDDVSGFSAHRKGIRQELYQENIAELAALLDDGAEGGATSDSEDDDELDRAHLRQ